MEWKDKFIACPVCRVKEMDQRINKKTNEMLWMCYSCGYAGRIKNGKQDERKTKFSKIAFANKVRGGVILNPSMIVSTGEYITKPRIIKGELKWYIYKSKYTYPHPHFTTFETKGKNIGSFNSLQEAVLRMRKD